MSVSPMNLYVRLSMGPVREEDVDALLQAMERPRAKGESAHARAEVLRRLVDDPTIGALRGRDGRRLNETAAHALRTLDEAHDNALSEPILKPLEPSARVSETVAPPGPSLPAPSPDFLPAWYYALGILGLFWGAWEGHVASVLMRDDWNETAFGAVLFIGAPLTVFLPSVLLTRYNGAVPHLLLRVVWILVLLAVPVSAVCWLLCFLNGGGVRLPRIGSLSHVFLIGGLVRLGLLIPIGVLSRRGSRRRRSASP